MWWLILPVLAYLLAGAHFLRAGDLTLVAAALVLLGLLAARRAWVVHLSRLALFISALVWLHTLVGMAATRYTMDMPFLRLSVILGTVILLTGGAIFVFSHPRLRCYYRLAGD